MSPRNTMPNRISRRIRVVLQLVLIAGIGAGCKEQRENSAKTPDSMEIEVTIPGRKADGMEVLYDGAMELEYRVNGVSVGKGVDGEAKLLEALKGIRGPGAVELVVPPRTVAGTGRAVRDDAKDLGPYITSPSVAEAVRRELDRIRKSR